jgi:hypothetical protein
MHLEGIFTTSLLNFTFSVRFLTIDCLMFVWFLKKRVTYVQGQQSPDGCWREVPAASNHVSIQYQLA